MRQLLAIFLAISLSWVTTSYACQMDQQNLVRALCCCKGNHAASGAAEVEKPGQSASAKKPCCDVSASSSVDQQQPAVVSAAPVLDLPAFAVAPALEWQSAPAIASLISLPPPARGPPGAGTRTYLATARLRL